MSYLTPYPRSFSLFWCFPHALLIMSHPAWRSLTPNSARLHSRQQLALHPFALKSFILSHHARTPIMTRGPDPAARWYAKLPSKSIWRQQNWSSFVELCKLWYVTGAGDLMCFGGEPGARGGQNMFLHMELNH